MWPLKLVLQRDPVPRLNLTSCPHPYSPAEQGEKGRERESEESGWRWGWRESLGLEGASFRGKERGGQTGLGTLPPSRRFLSHKRRQRAHQSCPAPAPAAATATARPRARRRLERPGARGPRRRRAPRRPPPAPRLRRHHRLLQRLPWPGSFHFGQGEGGGGRGDPRAPRD